jgi:L-aspartate oxidase
MTATDVLIIGSGLAGCTTALLAADRGLRVTLLTSKTDPDQTGSGRAQGGIIYRGAEDSPELLIRDIWNAGCECGFLPAIRKLAREGPDLVRRILFERLHVPFDRKADGSLDLTSEGAHSLPRIIHCRDITGKVIHQAILAEVRRHPGIKVHAGCVAIDLLTTGHSSPDPQDAFLPQTCYGVYAFHVPSGKVFPLLARETVLATGGLGGLFLHSSNPDTSRGDGIAMAHRAGARLVNMHYIQFHPTGLYHPTRKRFLLSESLRGEGAVLKNVLGRRFMDDYHPQSDLAPRDVVSAALYDQMVRYKTHFVYLDISHKDASWIRNRFPAAESVCREYGYDLTSGPVPVVPVAHYTCGGVLADLEANTTIRGLRAVGEVACTGLHGANRLASTSLLECLVWGAACAGAIPSSPPRDFSPPQSVPWHYENDPGDLALIYQDWQTLRNTMWNYVGPVRSQKRMERARTILTNLRREVENFYDTAELSEELIGLRNGIDAALSVLNEAMRHTQSRGCHGFVAS